MEANGLSRKDARTWLIRNGLISKRNASELLDEADENPGTVAHFFPCTVIRRGKTYDVAKEV